MTRLSCFGWSRKSNEIGMEIGIQAEDFVADKYDISGIMEI